MTGLPASRQNLTLPIAFYHSLEFLVPRVVVVSLIAEYAPLAEETPALGSSQCDINALSALHEFVGAVESLTGAAFTAHTRVAVFTGHLLVTRDKLV